MQSVVSFSLGLTNVPLALARGPEWRTRKNSHWWIVPGTQVNTGPEEGMNRYQSLMDNSMAAGHL